MRGRGGGGNRGGGGDDDDGGDEGEGKWEEDGLPKSKSVNPFSRTKKKEGRTLP